MKPLALALMLVAAAAACRRAEQQQPAQTADTTQMADTGMMMSDTAHMMAGDTAKKM